MQDLPDIPPRRPVLIAGPTASGKSGLALRIARRQGGVIINADAIQVFSDWRILTARPSPAEEAQAPHRLYGHVSGDTDYSVGHWLREVAPLLKGPDRPIIVGGTGLYFSALTEGLAEIPPVPAAIREEAETRLARDGREALLAGIDAPTRSRLDTRNPARVRRAWEVLAATGRGLAAWQDSTPPPLLPPEACARIVIDASRDWLLGRIEARLERMFAEGVLEEARANLPHWSPARPSAKAIGAKALIRHLRGDLSLLAARDAMRVETRQYAKKQRSWYRSRMKSWSWLPPSGRA